MLLCLDADAVAAGLAAGKLACPSCGTGRLAAWGYGRERTIRLRDGRAAPLRPRRARSGPRPHARAAAGVVRAAPRGRHRGHGHRRGPSDSRARPPGRRGLGFYPPGPPSEPAGSALGDALNALAAAVDCARRNVTYGREMTWALIGRLAWPAS